MNWSAFCGPRSEPLLPDPGLPRRLLRSIFDEGHVGIGSRVLDVGCGGGHLLRYLNQLCLDVAGLDESPHNVELARGLAPELSYHCGRAQDPLPFPEHSFNLVLARDLSVYEGNLFSYGALLSTARLLAVVRPGGLFLIIRQVAAPAADGVEPHRDECYARHLQTFSSDVSVTHVSAGWKWVPWQSGGASYQIARLRVSNRGLGPKDWLRIGQRAAAAGIECVCQSQAISARKAA